MFNPSTKYKSYAVRICSGRTYVIEVGDHTPKQIDALLGGPALFVRAGNKEGAIEKARTEAIEIVRQREIKASASKTLVY